MKRFGGIILGVATLLAGSALSAEVFYVDRDFQGEQPTGRSWLSAFPSVQEAIDAAASGGGEIWVKAGVYKPSGETRAATFRLKPGIGLYGGFRGNETIRSQRNFRANRTVLSGDIGRIGSPADNSHHVVTGSAKSRIDGFIVSAGNADGRDRQGRGAALLIDRAAKDFTAANCTFEKNHAMTGGAIHAAASGTTLSNCTFFSNAADIGGAVHIGNGADVKATACTFSANFAKESGGAVAIGPTSKTVVSNSWFLFNRTEGTGGAIASITKKRRGIRLELNKCEFNGNSAVETGGALFSSGAFYPMFSNCRFNKNVSKQGAGAIANLDGATIALLETTLVQNQSAKGIEEIASDAASKSVYTAKEAAAKLAVAKPKVVKPVVVKPKPKPKRQLADVFVLDASSAEVGLRELVKESDYTVFSTGDLTDPEFIASYRTIEAAARDYSLKGINFFYVYCHLSHPENHGHVQPFSLGERGRQIQEAKRLLRTRVPWLCDGMDNAVAKALGREQNNLFIFNKEGLEEYAGTIADGDAFRNALAGLAGKIGTPTPPDFFPSPDIAPVNMPKTRLVKRVVVGASQAIQTTPANSRTPFYVKMRAEASEELLETGGGRMYLGFHIDPLYQVEWNNFGKTLNYAIKPPMGTTMSPSVSQAKKITGISSDSEPREFLLDIRKWDPEIPVPITVNYSVHSPRLKRNIEVSQRYLLHLKRDPFGGTVLGRKVPEAEKPKNTGSSVLLLKHFDKDHDGMLSRKEAPGWMKKQWAEVDLNKDGQVTEEEYLRFRKENNGR